MLTEEKVQKMKKFRKNIQGLMCMCEKCCGIRQKSLPFHTYTRHTVPQSLIKVCSVDPYKSIACGGSGGDGGGARKQIKVSRWTNAGENWKVGSRQSHRSQVSGVQHRWAVEPHTVGTDVCLPGCSSVFVCFCVQWTIEHWCSPWTLCVWSSLD